MANMVILKGVPGCSGLLWAIAGAFESTLRLSFTSGAKSSGRGSLIHLSSILLDPTLLNDAL